MKNIIFLLSIILILGSCRTVKTVSDKSKVSESVETKETKKDSTNITKISEQIKENVSLSLRTNNKVVDSIIRQRLKGFQSSKKSGGNSYSAKFNYDKMVLDIKAEVAESISSNLTTNSEATSTKTFEEKTDEYFSKKISRMPFYVWILLGLYFLPKILAGITAIINPVQTLIGRISTIKKPPTNT